MRRAFQPLILCYHAVSDEWQHVLAVRPAAIERQLRALLRRGYRPATAAEIIADRGRRLHVTFDDAYRSVAGILPALERLGLSCTIFACADYALDGRPLGVPELAAEAKAHAAELATMSLEELRILAERGVEIGSHTSTHPHLTQLSERELELELNGSRARLEDALGRPCRFLAYPYGEHDARVRAAARSAGYEAAFGLRSAERQFDPFAVPRIGIYRRDHRLRSRLKTSTLLRRVLA